MRGRGQVRSAARVAARQRRLVTHEQLLGAGVTRRVIDGLVADGWLHRVHREVYVAGPPQLDRETRWLAATLATDGVLSHVSAGALWGILPSANGPVHITRATQGRRRAGIVVHECRLGADEVTVRFGVPTTSLVRTLIDLASVLPPHELARAFDQAQVLHHLRPLDLGAAVVAQPGRRGSRTLKLLLADAVDPGAIESHLELLFLRFCRSRRWPRPETQVPFGPWRVDFFFRDAALVVEADSRWHDTAARRRRDARKTDELEARGWPVLRFRWPELRDDPDGLARRIEAYLRPRHGG